MRKYFLIAVGLLALVAVGALVSRSAGFYYKYWYTDVLFHIISGAALGFLWLSLNQGVEKRKHMLVLGAASFAALLSIAWELWEFAGWRLTTPGMRFYVPELGDTLSDVCFGFVGALLSVAGKMRK